MADNQESFGNFGIVDTMEMGMGNAELLNDLLSPETSTSDPDNIEKIVETIIDPPLKKDETSRGKVIVPKEEGKEPTDQEVLANFLNDSTDEPEEEDDGIKKPVKSIIEKDPEEIPSDASQFAALSRDLLKLGVFTKEDEEEDVEINTPEEFLERFTAEKKKGAIEVVNNFIGQFGEDYQNAFEAIFVKGVNPKTYFDIYNTITDFTGLDLSVEDNQIKVIRQSMIDQGLESEDIESEIEQIKNYGDLESKATKYHKVLVKKEAAKLQDMEQRAQQELQQKSAIKNQYIQNVQQVIEEKLKTKEFDGIPINPKLANELHDFLLVDKYKTVSGETLTDFDKTILELKRPENHAQKVKVALLLKIMEKDPTLLTIQKSGITKKSDQLFGEVARQKTTSLKTSATSQQKPESWFK